MLDLVKNIFSILSIRSGFIPLMILKEHFRNKSQPKCHEPVRTTMFGSTAADQETRCFSTEPVPVTRSDGGLHQMLTLKRRICSAMAIVSTANSLRYL